MANPPALFNEHKQNLIALDNLSPDNFDLIMEVFELGFRSGSKFRSQKRGSLNKKELDDYVGNLYVEIYESLLIPVESKDLYLLMRYSNHIESGGLGSMFYGFRDDFETWFKSEFPLDHRDWFKDAKKKWYFKEDHSRFMGDYFEYSLDTHRYKNHEFPDFLVFVNQHLGANAHAVEKLGDVRKYQNDKLYSKEYEEYSWDPSNYEKYRFGGGQFINPE